jgi:signal transduction histidine kinase
VFWRRVHLSLHLQLTLIFLAVVLITSAGLGWLAYSSARDIVQAFALPSIEAIANGRERLLRHRVMRQQKRAALFLSALKTNCPDTSDQQCLRRYLRLFVNNEGAAAAKIKVNGTIVVERDSAYPLAPSDLDWKKNSIFFSLASGRSLVSLHQSSGNNGSEITYILDGAALDEIFMDRQELGRTGAAFLVSPQGTILSPSSFAAPSAEPMQLSSIALRNCQKGNDGALFAPDSRGVEAIHGYEHLEDFPGSCVMIRMDQSEAFTPVWTLQKNIGRTTFLYLIGAFVLSWYFARRISRPIIRLTERARALKSGDLTSAVPVGGPSEVRTLGRTFGQMASTLDEALKARNQLFRSEKIARTSLESQQAELRNAVATRDEFLSIAAHELKTPLTTLRLQMEYLKRSAQLEGLHNIPPDKLAKMLETSDRQVDRLSKLIDNLFDTTKITSGLLDLELDEVDLSEIIKEVVDRFSGQLQVSGCKVELDLKSPLRGVWDRARLEQVFINLLTNAMKYGGGRPIKITAGGDTKTAVLTVQDFGMGISDEVLGKLFQRFERGVPSSHFGGLGLGLYISKKIITAHGGTIEVTSEPDNGSVFVVKLPRTLVKRQGKGHGQFMPRMG